MMMILKTLVVLSDLWAVRHDLFYPWGSQITPNTFCSLFLNFWRIGSTASAPTPFAIQTWGTVPLTHSYATCSFHPSLPWTFLFLEHTEFTCAPGYLHVLVPLPGVELFIQNFKFQSLHQSSNVPLSIIPSWIAK